MKIKKTLKIISGIVIFLTLPSVLLYGFVYFKYNEPLPKGLQGPEADSLASNMLKSLNYKAFQSTKHIQFTYKNRRHYKWSKHNNTCEVFWQKYKVNLNLNDMSKSDVFHSNLKVEDSEKASNLINQAYNYFNMDSFWLVAPYTVFNEGTERKLVNTKDNNKALLVNYSSGDSYLWQFDKSGKPINFKMWESTLPIDGLEVSWTDWIQTDSGANLPSFHKFLMFGIEITDIATIRQN